MLLAKAKNVEKNIYHTRQILKGQILFSRNSIEFEGRSPFIFLSTRSTLLSAAKIQEIWNSNTSTWMLDPIHARAPIYLSTHTHTQSDVDILPSLPRFDAGGWLHATTTEQIGRLPLFYRTVAQLDRSQRSLTTVRVQSISVDGITSTQWNL